MRKNALDPRGRNGLGVICALFRNNLLLAGMLILGLNTARNALKIDPKLLS